MNLLAVGLNHTTAPLALREQIAFAPERIAGAVTAARAWLDRDSAGASEAAILSTCNRTEMYVAIPAAGAVDAGIDATCHFLADYHHLSHDELRPHLYSLPQDEAVRHAFRVASGLDSMVLGEPQILGQMKDAARHAEAAGGMGTYLHQLFQRTFSVAKEVRSSTAIGAHSVSMAAAALGLAHRIFPSIDEQHVLFIGAGEMIELCAAHFCAQHPKSVTVANRTMARGEALARRFNGQAIGLDELAGQLDRFDIIISCTGAPQALIGREDVERAIKARRRRPMFMVDLAVPRDIDSTVTAIADVFLYTVDDLGAVVQRGRELRQGAVEQAESIIAQRVHAYMAWADQRALVPVIRDLHARSETMRVGELDRARQMLARGADIDSVMTALSQRLTAKFVHGPQQALHSTRGAERAHLISVMPQLFRGATAS